MKIRFLPIFVAALLLSAAASEARGRRHPHYAPRRTEVVRESASADEGGPLARSRGLSQGESSAVGTVLAEIASSHAPAADAAANVPARRLSPDFYRVYSHRLQAAGAARRVAVAAPATKPLPAAAPAPAPVKPPVVAVRKVETVAPVVKVNVVAPPPAPVQPAPKLRVAVAAPVAKPPVAAVSKPTTVQPPTTAPRRVLMLPPGSTSRTITVPVAATAPVAKKRKADETIYAAAPPAATRAPIRAAFREPVQR